MAVAIINLPETVSVPIESTSIGTIVFQADTGATASGVTFSISSGNASALWDIDANSGYVTTQAPLTEAAVGTYNLGITATATSPSSTDTKILTITLTSSAPPKQRTENTAITHKRSSTAGNTPSSILLQRGELAINFADKKLFTRNASDNIITVGDGSPRNVEAFDPKTSATGTVTHDLNTAAIFRHTSMTGNFTANFTNVDTTNNQTTSVVLILVQGGTAYMPTAVQIGGTAATIQWQGGSAPSGTASGTDIVSFTLVRLSTGWSVLGSATSYS